MQQGKVTKTSVSCLILTILLLSAWGCSSEDPTKLEVADITLSKAMVSIGDQSLGGMDIQMGEFSGPMRFEAHLLDRLGNTVRGGRVQVQVSKPGMMGHMNRSTDEFYCYDDGAHGDLIAGDGIYCFVDTTGEYGCHRVDAPMGGYNYDFCGYDQQGHESNRMDVTVTLIP